MKVYLSSAIVLLLAGVTFLGCDNGFLSGKCSKEDTAYTLGYEEGKKTGQDMPWMVDNSIAKVGFSEGICRGLVQMDTEAEMLFPICQQGFLDSLAKKAPSVDLCPADKREALMDKVLSAPQ